MFIIDVILYGIINLIWPPDKSKGTSGDPESNENWIILDDLHLNGRLQDQNHPPVNEDYYDGPEW